MSVRRLVVSFLVGCATIGASREELTSTKVQASDSRATEYKFLLDASKLKIAGDVTGLLGSLREAVPELTVADGAGVMISFDMSAAWGTMSHSRKTR
jgi:hypothetical protein